jgi:hypothetical protein
VENAMGKLKGAVFGKLKTQRNVPEDLLVQIIDIEKELADLDFEIKRDGRKLVAWLGSLTLTIRFTKQGNTVITRYGAKIQTGHEEKLDLKETYDYISTKIANFLKEKDDS